MPIITDQNIVPVISAITVLVGVLLKRNIDSNHTETMTNIKRLDDHANTIGASTVAALADSVPITAIPAIVAAATPAAPVESSSQIPPAKAE